MGKLLLILIWFTPAYYIGLFGMKKRIGFWASFALSVILSPLAGIIGVMISKPKTA